MCSVSQGQRHDCDPRQAPCAPAWRRRTSCTGPGSRTLHELLACEDHRSMQFVCVHPRFAAAGGRPIEGMHTKPIVALPSGSASCMDPSPLPTLFTPWSPCLGSARTDGPDNTPFGWDAILRQGAACECCARPPICLSNPSPWDTPTDSKAERRPAPEQQRRGRPPHVAATWGAHAVGTKGFERASSSSRQGPSAKSGLPHAAGDPP